MDLDCYTQSKLVIEYLDKNNVKSVIYTDLKLLKGKISHYLDSDNDDLDQENRLRIEKRIDKNKYDKMLFENDQWIKKSYKKHYKKSIIKEFKDISKIIKIYKNLSSWENN
jgi:hypothetical protein